MLLEGQKVSLGVHPDAVLAEGYSLPDGVPFLCAWKVNTTLTEPHFIRTGLGAKGRATPALLHG